MSATVGVSPVSQLGQLADQRARTSVSERFDAVNTSGLQRRPVRRAVMVSLAIHRRRCIDRVRRNEHQWPASTWSERWDGVNGRSYWLERLKTTRRDGGHLRSTDGDVTTVQDTTVSSHASILYDQYYTSEVYRSVSRSPVEVYRSVTTQ